MTPPPPTETTAAPNAATGPEWTFEAAMERLEEIVERIEDGELELDESLALFEEGVRLLRFTEGVLEGAEDRIRQLLDEGEGTRLEPFAGEL